MGYDNSITTKFVAGATLAEKRAIVKKANPFHYQFGTKLKPYKPYLTYGENYGIEC
jgi:hypothetical protein